MTDRLLEIPIESNSPGATVDPAATRPCLMLESPPNWTAVAFLAALGCLHLSIAIPAFLKLRWEGYMSATLAVGFLTAAVVVYRSKCRIVFEAQGRRIRLRSGVGRFYFQRWISFDDVHAVRLTMSSTDRPRARIEILCDNEDIQCPPTSVPRQEALCLAVLLNVELIKVWADEGVDDELREEVIR